MARKLLILLFALPALAFAGCGDDDDAATTTAAETTPATTTEAPADEKDTETKPVIEVPEGDPPSKLVTRDIVKGKGRAAKRGDQLTMDYVGVAQSTGEEFDASWDRGEPFQFTLGQGQVIQGWDRGIEGMRVGGRRELVIPADLGYGAAGSPPAIGPDETLIFVVDLREIG